MKKTSVVQNPMWTITLIVTDGHRADDRAEGLAGEGLSERDAEGRARRDDRPEQLRSVATTSR